MRKLSILLVVLLALGIALSMVPSEEALSQASGTIRDGYVTRGEMMQRAEAYKTHSWTPSEQNIFHGACGDGSGWRVETPDRDTEPGWHSWMGWKANEENIGVPYQWGGFSSIAGFNYVNPEDFDNQYANLSYHAGDKYCVGNECTHACGVDCSGFVSRCWNLAIKQGTSTLPNMDFSWPIKFEDLRRGDILIVRGHVALFKEFLTAERTVPGTTRVRVYEASAKDWKVSEWEYRLVSIQDDTERHSGSAFETNEVTLEVVGRIDPEDGTLDTTIRPGSQLANYKPRTYNPIKGGLLWLREHQNPNDGSWYSDPAVTSFAVLAMLNWGYDETDEIVSEGIDYVLSKINPDGSVYNQSWRYTYYTSIAILPLAATGNPSYHDEIERMREWLIGSQWSEDSFYGSVAPTHSYYGGFGYGNGSRPDLSNTQWALIGLKAADRALGLQATATYAKAADYFVTRCQNADGGSGYTPGSPSILTMTAASVWSYKLCGRPSNDDSVLDGIQWLTDRYSLTNDDGWGNWSEYYYKVTLAKALTMTHRAMLGEHDWFGELAQKLAKEQNAEGNWPDTGMMGSEMSTAWAIMALQTRMPPPSGDFGLWATLESHSNLHMYDQMGRHTGINYETGMVEEDIPGSSFKILDPDGNEVPYSGGTPDEGYKQVIQISGVMPGSYRIELVGTSDGPFHLTAGGLSNGVEVNTYTHAGTITEGARLATYITVAWMEGFTVLHDPLTALPVLGVHPSNIDVVGSPNTVVQVAFAISEVSGGAKMHNVRAYCTGILGTQGSISGDNVVFDMSGFDVEPGGSQIVNASIPIPADFVGPGLGSIVVESADGGTRQVTLTVLTTITAVVDFDPNTLNLRGRGGGVVTVYIELPEEYDVGHIDVSSIRLNDTVSAVQWPYEVGDYNYNGVPDLMVKFDRTAVQAILDVGESVEITITGEVDGIPFMGVDTIRVIG